MVQRLSSGMWCLHVAPTLCPAADMAQLTSNSCSRDIHPACGTYPAAQPGWTAARLTPPARNLKQLMGKREKGKHTNTESPKSKTPCHQARAKLLSKTGWA